MYTSLVVGDRLHLLLCKLLTFAHITSSILFVAAETK